MNNLVHTKFVEIFDRAEPVLLTYCVEYLTPLGKQTEELFFISLYLHLHLHTSSCNIHNRHIHKLNIYILTIGNKQFQVLRLTFLFVTNLFFFT